MKPHTQGGVVDLRLNVYGVKELKVTDLSICLGSIAANAYPTAWLLEKGGRNSTFTSSGLATSIGRGPHGGSTGSEKYDRGMCDEHEGRGYSSCTGPPTEIYGKVQVLRGRVHEAKGGGKEMGPMLRGRDGSTRKTGMREVVTANVWRN